MVNSALFVNGNFGRVPASQTPTNRIRVDRGYTLIQASTLYWDDPTCAACTDKGMGLWITGPAASGRLRLERDRHPADSCGHRPAAPGVQRHRGPEQRLPLGRADLGAAHGQPGRRCPAGRAAQCPDQPTGTHLRRDGVRSPVHDSPDPTPWHAACLPGSCWTPWPTRSAAGRTICSARSTAPASPPTSSAIPGSTPATTSGTSAPCRPRNPRIPGRHLGHRRHRPGLEPSPGPGLGTHHRLPGQLRPGRRRNTAVSGRDRSRYHEHHDHRPHARNPLPLHRRPAERRRPRDTVQRGPGDTPG